MLSWLATTRGLMLVSAFSALAGATAIILTGWFEPGILFEVFWYVAIAGLMARSVQVASPLSTLPIVQRAGLAVITGVFVFAQIAGGGGHLYPSTRWAMFSDAVLQPRAVVVQGVDDQENVISLSPDILVGALRNGRGGSLVDRLVEAAAAGDSEALDDTLRALALRWEARAPDIHLTEIQVVRLTLQGNDPDPGAIHSEVLWSLSMEAAG